MKTIVPLRYWLLFAVLVFTSGCASTETTMTTRNCILQLQQQLAQNAFAVNLICEKEEPFKETK